MALTKQDFTVMDKFGFDMQPVCVKFLTRPPDMVDRLSEEMALCEMLRKAMEGNAFYADAANHNCGGGLYVLGQKELSEPYLNGEYGTGLGLYDSTRSASRLYHQLARIDQGVVDYVAFSSLDRLTFDPDVLVFLADVSQAEILLRAMSYKTGEMWVSRYTSAIGCSWILVYPYLSGEMNHITTGLGWGMKCKKLFREGLQLISIPFDRLPALLQSLRDMPWVPEPYKPDGDEYVRQLHIRLGLEPPK